MASVIRAARMDPERMLLAMRSNKLALRAEPEPAAAAADVAPPPVPSWSTPAAAREAPEPRAEFDREAEQRSFRMRLDTERIDVLEEAQTKGYAEGLRQGNADYVERLDELGALIRSARAALVSEIAGTEDVIVEIAFEAVCKILGEALLNSEGVVAIVREVLRSMREREQLLVRVAPADFELLEQHRAQLLQGEDGRTLDLVADERVVLGGCLVETTGGTLDGRLETQMQRLVDTLTSARRLQGEALP